MFVLKGRSRKSSLMGLIADRIDTLMFVYYDCPIAFSEDVWMYDPKECTVKEMCNELHSILDKEMIDDITVKNPREIIIVYTNLKEEDGDEIKKFLARAERSGWCRFGIAMFNE